MKTTTPQAGLGSSTQLRRYDDIRELIADSDNPTPLVRVGHITPEGPFSLFLKLEWMNPFGSIKDRTAKFLLDGLEERGELEGKRV